MPAFGEGSPFGQMQPTDLSAMLQAVYNPAQAPMPDQMQFQRRAPAENQFIDLGAGGPAPGSERDSLLGGLGDMAQAIAPMVGGAMSDGGAKPSAQGSFNQAANVSAAQAQPGNILQNQSVASPSPVNVGAFGFTPQTSNTNFTPANPLLTPTQRW